MAKSLSEFLDSKTDEQLGAHMRDRYTRLMEAADMGLCDHPVKTYNADNAVLRAHSVAKDGGNDPGDQPSVGDPNAQDDDDPPANATTRGVTGGPRNGARISEDTAQKLREWGISERRIREIATPSTVSAADRAAAAALVPEYDRLR